MACSACRVRGDGPPPPRDAVRAAQLRNPLLRRSGVVAPAGDPTAPLTPSSAPVPASDVDARGRLVGVDGVLDQVAEAMRRQVEPMVRDVVLPALQRDVALQRELGAAAGRSLAVELRPYAVVAAGALVLLAYSSWRRR